jgi:hypothetical protein
LVARTTSLNFVNLPLQISSISNQILQTFKLGISKTVNSVSNFAYNFKNNLTNNTNVIKDQAGNLSANVFYLFSKNSVDTLYIDKIQANQEVCIDGKCVNAEKLQEILNN